MGEVDRERLGEVSITECRMRDYGVCSQKETCRCLGKSNGPLSWGPWGGAWEKWMIQETFKMGTSLQVREGIQERG